MKLIFSSLIALTLTVAVQSGALSQQATPTELGRLELIEASFGNQSKRQLPFEVRIATLERALIGQVQKGNFTERLKALDLAVRQANRQSVPPGPPGPGGPPGPPGSHPPLPPPGPSRTASVSSTSGKTYAGSNSLSSISPVTRSRTGAQSAAANHELGNSTQSVLSDDGAVMRDDICGHSPVGNGAGMLGQSPAKEKTTTLSATMPSLSTHQRPVPRAPIALSPTASATGATNPGFSGTRQNVANHSPRDMVTLSPTDSAKVADRRTAQQTVGYSPDVRTSFGPSITTSMAGSSGAVSNYEWNKSSVKHYLPDGSNIAINDSGTIRTYDCNRATATINCNSARITLRGSYKQVVVNGHGNRIIVFEPAAITFNGRNNRLEWQAKRAPEITMNAKENTVEQRR